MRLKLLPKTLLVKTGEVDHADWNYRPLVGMVQRRRFRLCLKLLGDAPRHSLLVVGYGSGVFLPELRQHATRLYGIDIHQHHEEVAHVLQSLGVSAELISGNAERLPYPSGFFDTVVAVSSLEFIHDIDSAAASIARVLDRSGTLVVVMPAASRFVDFLLWLFTGAHADIDFQDRRQNVLPALAKYFEVERRLVFPSWLRWLVPVYYALSLKKKKS